MHEFYQRLNKHEGITMLRYIQIGPSKQTLLLVLLWACGVAALFGILLAHDKSYLEAELQTSVRQIAGEIPDPSQAKMLVDDWQVELYIHPDCPCTLATLRLLDQLWDELPTKPRLDIYIASYDLPNTKWSESKNYTLAATLTSARIWEDTNADRAKQHEAQVSGTLLVRNGQGKLLFRGGISSSRSCDDPGSSFFALRYLLTSGQSIEPTRVYGCSF
jgi:hypothetical protein